MKYYFRDVVVFEYNPITKQCKAGEVHNNIIGFNYCNFIDEDYKLLSEYFNRIYKHKKGKEVDLTDIKVY
jgi:hypothetical protein